MKKYLLLFALSSLLVGACDKKKDEPMATPCTAHLWGVSVPFSGVFDSITSCNAGIITTSGTFSGTASLTNSGYSKQGTFNSADNCYYVFKNYMGSENGKTLYKVTSTGGVSVYTSSLSGVSFSSICYNRVENKLYCGYYDGTDKLGEITISGSTFSVSPVATPIHSTLWLSGIAADNTTGAMYILMMDTTNCYVERKLTGSSSFSTTNTFGSYYSNITGICFNINDNILYAIKKDTGSAVASHLLKINPATGSTTSVGSFSSSINPEFYSATFDPCANQYVVSHRTGGSWATTSTAEIMRLNTSGAVVSAVSTSSLLLGLAVDY